MMPRPYLALLLDLDGTLTRVESLWKHFHESFSVWERDAEMDQERFSSGEIDYATFCRLDAQRIRDDAPCPAQRHAREPATDQPD